MSKYNNYDGDIVVTMCDFFFETDMQNIEKYKFGYHP